MDAGYILTKQSFIHMHSRMYKLGVAQQFALQHMDAGYILTKQSFIHMHSRMYKLGVAHTG